MDLLTSFGLIGVSLMLVFCALEGRNARFVLAFADACVLVSAYGFMRGAWPFGVVELVWACVVIARCRQRMLARTERGLSA